MSTHVLAICPTVEADERRGTLPALLGWGASLVLLAPLIAVAHLSWTSHTRAGTIARREAMSQRLDDQAGRRRAPRRRARVRSRAVASPTA